MDHDLSTCLEHQAANATSGQLVDLLFDRARRDLAGAHKLFSLEGGPRSATDAIRLIVHAQQIVAELHRSLNRTEGGTLSHDLARLYEYMQFRLAEAVAERRAENVTEVGGLLGEIHEAWRTIIQTNSQGTLAERAPRLGAAILVA